MKKVEDLMSRMVISMKPSDEVTIAKREMEVAAIRHLPVVDEHNRIVGILAMSDVLIALARRETEPVRVAEIMRREVVSTHRKTPAHEAARILRDHRIGSLPVVDDRGAVVGMLTETDFLQVAEEALKKT